MGKLLSKPGLSDFHKEKLMHEFTTFYDLDGDGTLTWEDFEVAKRHVCKLNGWPSGGAKEKNADEVFKLVWAALEAAGDKDSDGQISSEEWLRLWETLYVQISKEKTAAEVGVEDLPGWLYRYLGHRFAMYDRTGDGVIDVDEFEYVLEQFDARAAFRIFSQADSAKIDFPSFCRLAVEFYLSPDPAALGNYITGKVDFEHL